MINIAVVDDPIPGRNGVCRLLESFGYHVAIWAKSEKDLIVRLDLANLPQLVLLKTGAHILDGSKTAEWLKLNYPAINIIAFGMHDDEESIYSMLKHGAKAFLTKDATPFELKEAMASVVSKGYYYSNLLTYKGSFFANTVSESDNIKYTVQLSDRETEFLKQVCTELTYKEIAAKMYVSPRTIDNYREALFEKLEVKSRTGLCIYAIKRGIVKLE